MRFHTSGTPVSICAVAALIIALTLCGRLPAAYAASTIAQSSSPQAASALSGTPFKPLAPVMLLDRTVMVNSVSSVNYPDTTQALGVLREALTHIQTSKLDDTPKFTFVEMQNLVQELAILNGLVTTKNPNRQGGPVDSAWYVSIGDEGAEHGGGPTEFQTVTYSSLAYGLDVDTDFRSSGQIGEGVAIHWDPTMGEIVRSSSGTGTTGQQDINYPREVNNAISYIRQANGIKLAYADLVADFIEMKGDGGSLDSSDLDRAKNDVRELKKETSDLRDYLIKKSPSRLPSDEQLKQDTVEFVQATHAALVADYDTYGSNNSTESYDDQQYGLSVGKSFPIENGRSTFGLTPNLFLGEAVRRYFPGGLRTYNDVGASIIYQNRISHFEGRVAHLEIPQYKVGFEYDPNDSVERYQTYSGFLRVKYIPTYTDFTLYVDGTSNQHKFVGFAVSQAFY